MIKAFVFDIGDVLVDFHWMTYLEETFSDELVRNEIISKIFFNDAWREANALDCSYETYVNIFIDKAPHLEKEIRMICKDMDKMIDCFPFTHDLIDKIHRQGYKVYYLSNYSYIAYEQTKDTLSFMQDMDGGLLSYREGLLKPDSAFYELFLDRYGYSASEIVFFDDSEKNVLAARELGMQAVQAGKDNLEKEVDRYLKIAGGKRDMLKVVKFGGSSLASSEQFKKVKNIITAEEDRRYVIPSAPGRRTGNDTKVTDLLYQLYAKAQAGEDYKGTFEQIKSRYSEIIKGLGLTTDLSEQFKEIESKLSDPDAIEYMASRGECLNGRVLASYLDYTFIDAADVIRFDEKGNYLPEESKELITAALKKEENAVIPGFYGADAKGTVHTFSRGGSDITGAIVAGAMRADLYENWTDVSGMLIVDPHIVKDPEPIEVITYKELRELAYMGASVMHEDAIFPVKEAGVPINIKNTNRPEDPGTLIVEATCRPAPYVVTGIAGMKGFIALSLEKARMNEMVGYCRSVLDVFARHDINIEHMPSGIDTMSVIVHQDVFEEREQAVLSDLKDVVEYDHMEIESDLALIAVVGRSMRSMRGTAGRIFAALAHNNVNVRMIDQGSSELNIIIGVSSQDFETAIKAIYSIFVDTKKA